MRGHCPSEALGPARVQSLAAACAKSLNGFRCALLALTLAACGGGGGGAPPAPSMLQQWQIITQPNAGILPGLDICGSALAALGGFPLAHDVAQTSIDHGATWQDSPLAGGVRELGDSGYYWRGRNPN